MERKGAQYHDQKFTGRAAEFGNCAEIPCGLRGEDIPTIPGEVSQTVSEIHTNGGTTIKVRPEMVISEFRLGR